MKDSKTNEQRFNERYGHLKQIDPYEQEPDFHLQLSGKILRKVAGKPKPSRIRPVIFYIGASAAAAVILLLIILNPRMAETPTMPPVATTAEITVNDLPEMDEALIREVVMESLDEHEDLLSFAEVLPQDDPPIAEDSDDDYIQYFIDNMTVDEIIRLLMQNNFQEP
jgi:hypothetical protein